MKLFTLPDPIVIDSKPKALELVKAMSIPGTEWAIDTETTGFSIKNKTTPILDKILCWSVANKEDRYFIHDPQGSEHFLPLFKDYFASPSFKIFHNIKYDCHCLLNHGIQVNTNWADTMVMHWLADERKAHDLKYLSKELLGLQMTPYTKMFPRRPPKYLLTNDFKTEQEWNTHYQKVVQYASLDAFATYHLYSMLKVILAGISWRDGKSLLDFYMQIERQFTEVLFTMERSGICIDTDYLEQINRKVSKRIDEIQLMFNEIVGGQINLNSNPQLRKLFYEQLKFPIIKKTKGGSSGKIEASTDIETLKELRQYNPKVIDLLVEYRTITKLKSTYVERNLQNIKLIPDGRLHSTYNQHVTVSGRLSSTNPNSQNIKKQGEDEYNLRQAFISGPGKSFIIADYSQAEVRLIADFSGDEKLMEDLKSDVYVRAYSRMFKVPEDQVTKTQRAIAKTIVLGTNYGMGPGKLEESIDQKIGWDKTQFAEEKNKFSVCQDLLSKYFAEYTALNQYLKDTPFLCKLRKPIPHVRTLLGRYRRFPEILCGEKKVESACSREAINTGPQGGVGDIMRGVMLKIYHHPKLREYNAQLLMQIHDEIVMEVEDEHAQAAKEIVEQILAHPLDEYGITFKVPLEVEIVISKIWKKG